jgi:predicted nucleic-acid-binding protein
MIALDTNVLARLLLRDDEAQYRKAIRLFSDGREYTAPPTVMLELVWVLGSYGHSRADIAASLKSLLGLPNFKPKQGVAIAMALVWYEAGMDFGDALHLAMSNGDEAFATFDARLAKRARHSGVLPAIELL